MDSTQWFKRYSFLSLERSLVTEWQSAGASFLAALVCIPLHVATHYQQTEWGGGTDCEFPIFYPRFWRMPQHISVKSRIPKKTSSRSCTNHSRLMCLRAHYNSVCITCSRQYASLQYFDKARYIVWIPFRDCIMNPHYNWSPLQLIIPCVVKKTCLCNFRGLKIH